MRLEGGNSNSPMTEAHECRATVGGLLAFLAGRALSAKIGYAGQQVKTFLSDSLEYGCNTLTSADALSRQRVTSSFTPQQAGGFADDASTRCAHWMTEGDGTPVYVERLIANAQLLNTGERLARERLVQFDHIDGRNI